MTDRYENIRKALAMEPTPGPWRADAFNDVLAGGVCVAPMPINVRQRSNGHFIAACDPDTIRALLEERDALEAAREDAERLDALEALVNEQSDKALLLHHGMHIVRSDERRYAGLGLSNTGRSLRQAIDQVRGKENGNG